jgi:hypothetical protein
VNPWDPGCERSRCSSQSTGVVGATVRAKAIFIRVVLLRKFVDLGSSEADRTTGAAVR